MIDENINGRTYFPGIYHCTLSLTRDLSELGFRYRDFNCIDYDLLVSLSLLAGAKKTHKIWC